MLDTTGILDPNNAMANDVTTDHLGILRSVAHSLREFVARLQGCTDLLVAAPPPTRAVQEPTTRSH